MSQSQTTLPRSTRTPQSPEQTSNNDADHRPASKSSKDSRTTEPEAVRNHRIAELEAEIASLKAQLNGADPVLITRHHHELLHLYNETKDATQGLIGRYADLTTTPLREIYEELGLPQKDD